MRIRAELILQKPTPCELPQHKRPNWNIEKLPEYNQIRNPSKLLSQTAESHK